MLKWCFILCFFFIIRPAFSQNAPTQVQSIPDTIEERQDLYNGIKWTNEYRNFESDQFLFSDLFLDGAVSMKSDTWENLKIKYDVYSDEIITPLNLQDIIQLNKELVDSFTLDHDGSEYRFINFHDSISSYSGYFSSLYKGNYSLLVKYRKIFSSPSKPESDGNFILTRTVYLKQGAAFYRLKGVNSFYKVISEKDRITIKDFIRTSKIRISKKAPYSFIPLVKFYDHYSQPSQ